MTTEYKLSQEGLLPIEIIAVANQTIGNLERKNEEIMKILEAQDMIIKECLAQIPVGNIEMHTPEKLSDKISYFVRGYTESLETIENLEQHQKILEDIANDQGKIIKQCMAAVPVGNITTHTYENLSERMSWYVTEYCELSNAEDALIELIGCEDVDSIDDVITYIRKLFNVHSEYITALEIIREGTQHSQEIANKALGWSGSEHYQVELLREDNLRLRLELEDIKRNIVKNHM